MTIRRMRIACSTNKAQNHNSEYVILITFPLQQWLLQRASNFRLNAHFVSCFLPNRQNSSVHLSSESNWSKFNHHENGDNAILQNVGERWHRKRCTNPEHHHLWNSAVKTETFTSLPPQPAKSKARIRSFHQHHAALSFLRSQQSLKLQRNSCILDHSRRDPDRLSRNVGEELPLLAAW